MEVIVLVSICSDLGYCRQILNTPNVLKAEFSPNGQYKCFHSFTSRFLCVFSSDSSFIQVLDTLTYSHLISLGSIQCLPQKIQFSQDSALLVVENS